MAESPDTRLLSETNSRRLSVVRGEQYEDIRDHGAKVDGVTDDLDAFTKAFIAGRRVFVPAGTTRVRSAVLVPSNSELFGAGIDVSIIKLTDSAPRKQWVVTNSTRSIGNTNVTVRDLTLDWNQTRQGGLESDGGSRSSCITFGNVQQGLIRRVKAVGAGNHGFDITCAAEDYPYNGDGAAPAAGPSRHVTIEECIATNWGDDGFTTHHSEFITLTNNYAYSPRKKDNCNGFEIDDGSRDVVLNHNRTAFCYGGVEIKAHGNAPAATRVTINGHHSYRDVRSYHFRHIGHHIATDPKSLTAYDIQAKNLVSLEPGNRTGFQDEVTPAALMITAYANVSVDGLIATADPGYNFAASNVIELKWLTNNVTLRNITIRGFTTAGTDIYVRGGDNRADRVTIDGVNIYKSAPKAIGVGTLNPAVNIGNINAVAPDTGAVYGIDVGFSNAGINLNSNVTLTGYPVSVRHNGTDYVTSAAYQKAKTQALLA